MSSAVPAGVPPPPGAAVPLPPMAAIPLPPMAAIPLPPMAAVPLPPLPPAAVPPPAPVPPPPPAAAVPAAPSSTGTTVPPPAAVPLPVSTAGAAPAPLPPPQGAVSAPIASTVAPVSVATALPAAPALPVAATAAPSAPPLPIPMPMDTWLRLEAEARQRIPNKERTRYLDLDEVLRDQVCRLFIQSDYDVLKLLSNITKGLQHLGRHDVGLLRNGDFTAFTITQSVAYGGRSSDESLSMAEQRRHLVAESIARINATAETSKAILYRMVQEAAAAAAAAAGMAPPAEVAAALAMPAPQVQASASAQVAAGGASPEAGPFRKTTYEAVMEKLAEERRRQQKQLREERRIKMHRNKSAPPGSRRPAVETATRPQEHQYPPTYNGNYLLRRYGGGFGEEGYYSNYRYTGLKKK